MWDILRLPCRHVHVYLFFEDEDDIFYKMRSIIYLCGLSCASWLPRLKTYGSEIGWDLGFELGLPVGMILGAPFGYPLVYYINMFLLLALFNSFFTWEVCLV